MQLILLDAADLGNSSGCCMLASPSQAISRLAEVFVEPSNVVRANVHIDDVAKALGELSDACIDAGGAAAGSSNGSELGVDGLNVPLCEPGCVWDKIASKVAYEVVEERREEDVLASEPVRQSLLEAFGLHPVGYADAQVDAACEGVRERLARATKLTWRARLLTFDPVDEEALHTFEPRLAVVLWARVGSFEEHVVP